jgi:glutathione S-transferase
VAQIVVDNPKQDWFLALNPNGRVPALTDPNNDNFTIWESGAIVEYLVELYDKQGKLTVEDSRGKWALRQYLHFQMSGQVSNSGFLVNPRGVNELSHAGPVFRSSCVVSSLS